MGARRAGYWVIGIGLDAALIGAAVLIGVHLSDSTAAIRDSVAPDLGAVLAWGGVIVAALGALLVAGPSVFGSPSPSPLARGLAVGAVVALVGGGLALGAGLGSDTASLAASATLAAGGEAVTVDESDDHAHGDDSDHDDSDHDDSDHDDAAHSDGTHDDSDSSHGHTAGTGDAHADGTHTDGTGDSHAHTAGATDPGGHAHAPAPPGAPPVDPCAPTAHTDGGGHGHGLPAGCPPPALSAETQYQLSVTWRVAAQFPTTAAARSGGFFPVTDYIPGIAAHYLQLSWLDDRFVISEPEFMLYGREGQLVGVAYFVRSGANPPEGFTGTADGWHRHLGLCLSLATLLVIGGDGSDPGDCARRGGFIFGGQEYWLLHAWVVPGFGSPSGVFSGEHPLLI